MNKVVDFPLLVFALSLAVMWLASRIGAARLRQRLDLDENAREDFGVILGSTLTLLGLIIGFSFSMAVSRYDQRKNCEEAEANAIGTEYVRADLLPAADAAKVRTLLSKYLEQRILFYSTRSRGEIRRIDVEIAAQQRELWAAVTRPAATLQTPIVALAVAGMNDVLNTQGYTQAAWWNRIPTAAWTLMLAIAVCCNLLIGYGARNAKAERALLLILPLVVSISFFLIADIDSPRGGVIHVSPENLLSLAGSMRPQ
jgi:hypothetical protein